MAAAALLTAIVAMANLGGAAGAQTHDPTDPLASLHSPEGRAEFMKSIPPEIIAQHSAPPTWMSQTHEERSEHLRNHIYKAAARRNDDGIDEKRRRMQWNWQDTDSGDRDANLNDAMPDAVVGAACDDPLALNTGQDAACTYDCDALKQEFFPDQPSRCFLYDPSARSWPAELPSA